MRIIQTFSWIARLAGLGALILGLLFWFAGIALISLHMIFGFLVAISLLALSIALITTRGGRVLGIIGVVFAIVVPVVGELQTGWYVLNALWLVPTIHLLLGVAAVGLAQVITGRYMRLKQTEIQTSSLRASQAAH